MYGFGLGAWFCNQAGYFQLVILGRGSGSQRGGCGFKDVKQSAPWPPREAPGASVCRPHSADMGAAGFGSSLAWIAPLGSSVSLDLSPPLIVVHFT